MFRRGPFRRARLLRPAPAAPLASGPRQMLMQANHLMETQKYTQAADIYQRLAEAARTKGMLQRAPHLYLQAARARLYAGQVDPSLALLRQGLNLLVETGRWEAASKHGHMAVEELQRANQPQHATQIQAWLDQTLKDRPKPSEPEAGQVTRAQTIHPKLPARCTQCSAALRPNEIEWLDEDSAECPYCGSVLQPED